MGADVQVSKGVNSYITSISLNAGLARKGEAGTIEDENQERRNIKNMLKGGARNGFALFHVQLLITAMEYNHLNF